VLDQQTSAHSLTLRLAAPAGSNQTIQLRINRKNLKLHATGIDVAAGSEALQKLQVTFPAGSGYVEKELTFNW
jgi:hypothetical protein